MPKSFLLRRFRVVPHFALPSTSWAHGLKLCVVLDALNECGHVWNRAAVDDVAVIAYDSGESCRRHGFALSSVSARMAATVASISRLFCSGTSAHGTAEASRVRYPNSGASLS